MRVCEKCGFENADPHSGAESWCTRCGDFLGFPTAARDRDRQIRLLLVDATAPVRPGAEAVLVAQVHNRGDIVETVALTLEGAPAGWGRPEPDEVGLFPNQKSEVRLRFRPPRSPQVPAGVTPFRLVATSKSDATVSDRAEGSLDVTAFVDVKASLVPLHSSGLAGAEHRLVVDNAGNAAVDVALAVADPDNGLTFGVDPSVVRVGPAAQGHARIRVAPRQTLDGASARTFPFAVSVQPPDQVAITIQAVHVQEAPATAPTLVLAESRLHGAPGQEVATAVTLRNRGGAGENYTLDVLGPAAGWARVVPPTVFLPPGGEASVKVVFVVPAQPPAPAAELPFGLRCVSGVDPSRSAVSEGTVTVDAISDVHFDAAPRQVRGRWSGRYVIEVDNQGNTTARLHPAAVDPEHALSFALSPPELRVAPGRRAVVVLKARTRRPRLVAKRAKRPFQVFVTAAGDTARVAGRRAESGVDLSFEQVSVWPRKIVAVVATLVILAGLGAAAMAMFGLSIKLSM